MHGCIHAYMQWMDEWMHASIRTFTEAGRGEGNPGLFNDTGCWYGAISRVIASAIMERLASCSPHFRFLMVLWLIFVVLR